MQPASIPALEVADVFRDHGAEWHHGNAGQVSPDQMKAIERCCRVALGGQCSIAARTAPTRSSRPPHSRRV
jgi:hypothetical protein